MLNCIMKLMVLTSIKDGARMEKELYEKVDNHEKRITSLETNEKVTAVQFKNLCDKVGDLTKALWFLGTSIFVSLAGFFIWYVQSIPRN
jgi:hypothetical protein